MENSRITVEMLEDFLYTYGPYEELNRNYYLTHRRFMPESMIPAYLLQPVVINPLDLRNITEDVAKHTPSFFFNLSKSFKEHHFFSPNLDIYIQKQPRYAYSPRVDHQYYEICYQYTGESVLKLYAEDDWEEIILRTGDFLFIPVAQSHDVTIDSDAILLNIGIKSSTFAHAFSHNIPDDSILGQFFTQLLFSNDRNIRYILFHAAANAAMKQIVQNLSLTYCTHTIYSQQMMNLQLSILFINLLQNHSYNAKIGSNEYGINRKIPAVMQYIEQNYTHITVQDIADQFGYSNDYLNQIFKKVTTHTLGETLSNLKIQKAGALLISTDIPVSSIAEYLGYRDTTSLIRSFKKYYGLTPLQYRKTYGKEEKFEG